MVDDLAIPTVPEAHPDDAEDVSWALSTAEAMWARGDHSEGIKWVRKAAEAASEAENDERALELAKAAADLAGLVTRRSRVAKEEAPPPPAQTARAGPPVTRSVPPAPGAPSPPRVASQAPPPGARPLTRPPPAMPSGKPAPTRTERRARRSRENLAGAARSAGLLAPTREVPLPSGDSESPKRAKEPASRGSSTRSKRRSRHDEAPQPVKSDHGSTDEWDASPTASMSREELDSMDIEPVVASPAPIPPPAPPPAPRAPNPTLHDPELSTCQAIRVVIWQDGNGVHIAPAGTRVSAITVEGLVVALDPNTDLTAWLSRRDRDR